MARIWVYNFGISVMHFLDILTDKDILMIISANMILTDFELVIAEELWCEPTDNSKALSYKEF